MPPPLFVIRLTVLAWALALASCNDSSSTSGPVIQTPLNAKVDLSKVRIGVKKAKLICIDHNHFQLVFDYTLQNKAGATLSFDSIYSGKDDLIQVNLSDKNGDPLFLGKRPLEGLTLAAPRAILIPIGKSTRAYKVPVMPELRVKGDPITLRVRFHAPSRYDELRSSIEAPLIQVPWPKSPELKVPIEDNPLTYPTPDATPLPQR